MFGAELWTSQGGPFLRADGAMVSAQRAQSAAAPLPREQRAVKTKGLICIQSPHS